MGRVAPRSYAAVRALARLLLRFQYRRLEIEGADRVPATGPLLLVANHFSAITDSMALLDASPRPVSFLAKAPLWKSRLLRPFLDALAAVPVFRPQDAPENEGAGARANLETFQAARDRLAGGACLAVFPEGVSQPQPRLMPLRTGAARILIDLDAAVRVLPVALVWEHPTAEGRGSLLVRFGAPFEVHGAAGHESRRAAIAGTTRRIELELRDLLAEAASQGELDALRALRIAWDQARGRPPPAGLAERHLRDREFARALATLRTTAPTEIEALRAESDAWLRALRTAGLEPPQLAVRHDARGVLRFLAVDGLPLLLLEPLTLIASVLTWPFRAVGDVLALRAFGGAEDVRALCRLLGAGLVTALVSAGAGLAAGLARGPWAALAGVLALPLLMAVFVVGRDRRREIRARVRGFLLLAGGHLRGELLRQRRGLVARLEALAGLRAAASADGPPPREGPVRE